MNGLDWPLVPILAEAVAATPLGARSIHVYWFVLPLILAISLVYSASRHESWPRIWAQSLRICGMIAGILIVTTMVLLLINTQV